MVHNVYDQIAKVAQNCVLQNPVLILGSGASVPFGLRGMGALAEYLSTTVEALQEEKDVWDSVCAALGAGVGLESALHEIAAPPSLVRKIVAHSWEAIASDDLDLMQRVIHREVEFPLADMLQGLFNSTHTVVSVITTNYDRVVEYSSDSAGYLHETGFSPGIIRSRQQDNIIPYSNRAEMRRVRIWKVHGSIDWFMDKNEVPMCLPLSRNIPDGFTPLIVTPGTSKFERTHDEPFRSAIQGADAAITKSTAILCIGYGFRDRHVQPKIIERCRSGNVPIVVLAQTLTTEAHDFLKRSGGRAWIALEQYKEGTRVFSFEHPDGIILDEVALWSFDEFNGMVF